MSADKFDNELSDLYQQRKQQTQAPTFTADQAVSSVKSSRSPWHILALLVTGGAASFGIMALVTHFAKPPVHGVSEQYKQHSVRIVELNEISNKESAIPPPKPPLPPKPTSTAPELSNDRYLSQVEVTSVQLALPVNKALNHKVTVPNIDQPVVALSPTHRVMPVYPKSALYTRKSGTVKLQYRISNEGKVIDITGLDQHGDRLLERSAKQALSQWRYPVESASDELLKVEFEFNLTQ